MLYWSLLQQDGATGSFAVDTSHSLNHAIDRSPDVHVDSLGAGGRPAVGNGGCYGVAEHDVHRLAVDDGDDGFTGRLRISLEGADGTVPASTDVGSPGARRGHCSYALTTPGGSTRSTGTGSAPGAVRPALRRGRRRGLVRLLGQPLVRSRPCTRPSGRATCS